MTFPFQNLLQNWGSQCFRQHWRYMTLMQTLLFGYVPVLSQMTEVHAGFLMMKRSVSECMYIIMLQLWVRKVCNYAKADNCVLELTHLVVLKELPSFHVNLTSTRTCYWWLHKWTNLECTHTCNHLLGNSITEINTVWERTASCVQ